MKKNKVFIVLALIFLLQLAVPVSIMGLREVAESSGLQGKLKVNDVWYSLLNETLDFDIEYDIYKDFVTKGYTSVYLDEDGFVVSKGNSLVKPSGAYVDREKFRSKNSHYEKHQLSFNVSEAEVHRLTLSSISDKYYDNKMNFYVTVSIYEGEIIYKELWLDDTKLLEFR